MSASETALLRLSRYHCLLGEMLGTRPTRPVTSGEIAEELGVSEETVRHDLRYVRIEGRPGSGYDLKALHAALQEYLELSSLHPFVAVGSADMLRGLAGIFPAASFGMRLAGHFSPHVHDAGVAVAGVTIEPLSALPHRVRDSGIRLALVACEPQAVDDVLKTLAEAGITGTLMLTPVIRPRHPDGMKVTYFRIPCALKSLAAVDTTQHADACC